MTLLLWTLREALRFAVIPSLLAIVTIVAAAIGA